MAYVYRHIRLDKNIPFYIGIGSDGAYKRAYSKLDRNKFWNYIVGKTNYEVEIMLDDITWEYASEKEKEFINLYGRSNLGNGYLCNLTDGGEGCIGFIASKETRSKMSESRKGKKKSKETIEK